MIFDKRIIEIDVMGHKDGALQQGEYFFGHVFKSWRILHHLVGNAGKRLYIPRNGLVRVDEGFKMFHNGFAVKQLDRNFGDAIGSRIAAGGFNIYNGIQHKPIFER